MLNEFTVCASIHKGFPLLTDRVIIQQQNYTRDRGCFRVQIGSYAYQDAWIQYHSLHKKFRVNSLRGNTLWHVRKKFA
jgi:hypothetical protein